MKQHTMEVHHEVYDEDPDWRELMVDDEKNKYFHAQQVRFLLTLGRQGCCQKTRPGPEKLEITEI